VISSYFQKSLKKLRIDIEKALLKIDEVASNQEGIAAEEALILRGYVIRYPFRSVSNLGLDLSQAISTITRMPSSA
jgi:hypothetical protein